MPEDQGERGQGPAAWDSRYLLARNTSSTCPATEPATSVSTWSHLARPEPPAPDHFRAASGSLPEARIIWSQTSAALAAVRRVGPRSGLATSA